jgi:nucleoside-diphosphate-sugar epimerase
VILCLLRGETPKLSTGERPNDWIYIDDVIDGFLAAAHGPSLEGQTFDIGSGRLVPIRDVVGELVNLINPDIKPEFGVLPDRPLEQVRVADISETWTMFNWRPQTSLLDGLKKTVDWYEHQLRQGTI